MYSRCPETIFFHPEGEVALWHIMIFHELPDLYGTSWNISYLLCKLATHAKQAPQLRRGVKMGAKRSGVEQAALLDRKGLCAGCFLALSDICISSPRWSFWDSGRI